MDCSCHTSDTSEATQASAVSADRSLKCSCHIAIIPGCRWVPTSKGSTASTTSSIHQSHIKPEISIILNFKIISNHYRSKSSFCFIQLSFNFHSTFSQLSFNLPLVSFSIRSISILQLGPSRVHVDRQVISGSFGTATASSYPRA